MSDEDKERDSSCSATGAAVMAETNVDRPHSTATHGRVAENPTLTTEQEENEQA